MVLNIELLTRGCQVWVPTTMVNVIKMGIFGENSLLVGHSFLIFKAPYIDAASFGSYSKREYNLLQSERPFQSNHFNNWYGVLQVCFGEKTLVAREAQAWITHVDQYESSYDACFISDPEFGARVLGLIDLTFFELWNACHHAQSIADVSFTAIPLHHEQIDIL